MPLIDLPLNELYEYMPELTAKDDFDAFWEQQRKQSAGRPLNARLTKVDYPVKNVSVYEVVYDGIDGTPIHGWYIVPSETISKGPMPVVVGYHGYSFDRGFASDQLHWALMGIASFTIDTRGQAGKSPDYATYPQGSVPGFMTLGILDPHAYFYKNAYMDCVRAVDFVCSREEIDSEKIIVSGGSQGGALSLAVAGIDKRPKLMLNVFPYLCHFKRAVEMHTQGPYSEIREWFRRYDGQQKLEEQVYDTLSYFDGMNFATRITAKTLMVITLQDQVCPPSTCFAAYNHLNGEKELILYPEYGHEAIPGLNEQLMRFVGENLNR
jgi:cephalosporin-C deacetylase